MKTILITGGAVHGKLDDVKLVTNRFRGGMMAEIAEIIANQHECAVIYLTTKSSKIPVLPEHSEVVYHDGFYDYRDKVLMFAKKVDGIVLGGAVANLIPQQPFPGKFPSHNYKPGDVINIPFVIAPRVIDEIKTIAPRVMLFGFKLLSGVPFNELIDAAYGVLRESRADVVFANDAGDLTKKYAVTKEKGAIPLNVDQVARFVIAGLCDDYYQTKMLSCDRNITDEDFALYRCLIRKHQDDFIKHNDFGTVAVRIDGDRFMTTTRSKLFENNIVQPEYVIVAVDHNNRIISCAGDKKATLNAPLLAHLFQINPGVKFIVHTHDQIPDLPSLPYAPPATVRDSLRGMHQSFNIEHHGCYLLGYKK